MIRIVAAAMALAIAVSGVLALRLVPARTTHGCSGVPADFERDTRAAAFVALVDAVQVGGAVNDQPRLPSPTPSPAYQALVTDTPLATATSRPRGVKTVAPSETVFPTWTPVTAPTPELLTGIGATLDIVALYAGEVRSPVTIDAYGRAVYERYLREREALFPFRSSCEGLHPEAYQTGERYVVFGLIVNGGFTTNTRISVDGDDAVFGAGGLAMTEAAYHRYFDGLPVKIEEGYARLTVERMPLSTLARAVGAARGRVIVPPETGSAGLASGR